MPSTQVNNKTNASDELDTRERILNAALAEFSSYGFEGSSVRSIGKRAEVDFTLITYYFKTKENLWKAVIQRSLTVYDRLISTAVKNAEGKSPGEKLRARFVADMDFAYSEYSIFRLVMEQQQIEGGRSQWLVEELLTTRVQSLVELVEAAQASGEVIPGNAFMLSRMMHTSLRSMLLHANEFKGFLGVDAQDSAVRQEFWELFDSVYLPSVESDKKT